MTSNVPTANPPDFIRVHLHQSKTDPFGNGAQIFLGRTKDTVCSYRDPVLCCLPPTPLKWSIISLPRRVDPISLTPRLTSEMHSPLPVSIPPGTMPIAFGLGLPPQPQKLAAPENYTYLWAWIINGVWFHGNPYHLPNSMASYHSSHGLTDRIVLTHQDYTLGVKVMIKTCKL